MKQKRKDRELAEEPVCVEAEHWAEEGEEWGELEDPKEEVWDEWED